MITASIVTYEHHLLDIEPVLRSLFVSPVDTIYIIDHSESMKDLNLELQEFAASVLQCEPELRRKAESGFRLLYFPHENGGYGDGHNFAMQMAQKEGSQYHLVVNPDIWFGPEVMSELLRYMASHPEVGQMMPKILFPNGYIQCLAKMLPTPMDVFGRFCLPEWLIRHRNDRFELRHSEYSMILNVPFLSGCFMLFRMSALREVGMFDDRFFMYAEDVDLTRRMHARYQTIFYPQCVAYHKFTRASHHNLKLCIVHVWSMVKYFNKWGWWKDHERALFNRQCDEEIRRNLLIHHPS